MKNKKLQIHNSTAEFLIFTKQENKNTIEVRIEDETVWLTQKLMGVLFQVSVATINEHLANIYSSGELLKTATIRKFRIVQTEGTRPVNRDIEFHSLDAIINRELIATPGKVSQAIAKAFAESEFEKYRIVQDQLFESDFDKMIKRLEIPGA